MSVDLASNIYNRVKEKKESYHRYNFERLQEEAFATFFDLAQEYTSLESLYQICVAVPKEFFGLESRLFVIHPKVSRLEMVCSSEKGLIPLENRTSMTVTPAETPYETEKSRIFPIRGNQALTRWIPFLNQSCVLGMFEIYPKNKVDSKENFFFEKFTNRIGYNLHQKMLIQQHIDHIKFINQLVSDIEHNVISPNLYYKLFLLHLKKNLGTYNVIQQNLCDVVLFLQDEDNPLLEQLCGVYANLKKNNQLLEEEYKALSKHYEHTSLFLETLFRRDHFEKGTYVLRKQTCNFKTEIIEPLLERYLPIFEKKGIVVDNRLESVPDEHVTLFVDKGLISQVFDNLFSNAVKYTDQVQDQMGNSIKLLSYNRQILKDFFGENIHGVRFNLFTTGKTLRQEAAERLFEEGYRASNALNERGSGHGLHFVRNVVEIHGGKVGFEPQRYGNLLYFILPMKEQSVKQEPGLENGVDSAPRKEP